MNYPKVAVVTLLACFGLNSPATVRYVAVNNPQAVYPYAGWSTAATNIQDAINASTEGDFIWVTNGVYATGGKVMSGDLTNRVALDKAITVQSVNGPYVTIIQGAGATNGTSAVRCAWLTNSAILQGFTLRAGATRITGDISTYNGGGAWCASSNATIANCLILSNTCSGSGGGVYQGAVRNCGLTGNSGSGASAAYKALLYNCTVCTNYGAAAVAGGWLTNCVIYSNLVNYVGSTLAYCCTTPLPSGPGNISANPQLISDNIHLSKISPCRGAGINVASGIDLDGQPWGYPPSIGCDEWQPEPIIVAGPAKQLTSDPVGFTLTVAVAGQEPFTYWWLRNGNTIEDDGHFSSAHSTSLAATGVGAPDGGMYQVIVSNGWGMATSAVAQLVIHYVNVAATNSVAPYSDWSAAANNIQDAVDAALPGEVVLVTNGVYATGGRPGLGTQTNRVVVGKPLLLQSINGSAATIIQGSGSPSLTDASLTVRCVLLTNAAILSGFTLVGGTAAVIGSDDGLGGGVHGSATNLGVLGSLPSPVVANSLIVSNNAWDGGGAYQVVLLNSRLQGNASQSDGGGANSCTLRNCVVAQNSAGGAGGGTWTCSLKNCAVLGNSARGYGGGCYYGSLLNSTVAGNSSGTLSTAGRGGGSYLANATNSILFGNQVFGNVYASQSNYSGGNFRSSCTLPLPTGAGNLNSDPQFLADGIHVAVTSPCRGAGTSAYLVGADIDGQPWSSPPSIGCDEWWPAPALVGSPQLLAFGAPVTLSAVGCVAGQPPFSCWWLKNDTLLDDGLHYSSSHTTNLLVSNFGPADAGGYQLIASNAFGVITSDVAQVVVHCADPANASPTAPYFEWSSAAKTLQDAIDIATAGEFVLATNGVYSAGGRAVGSSITNRVVIAKPLTVISVNGPEAAAITGRWDPETTNGAAAIRGVWLDNCGILNGFTIQNGATGSGEYGGGVWVNSSNGVVINCVITNNQADSGGGGVCQGCITNCQLLGNQTGYIGGGAYASTLFNCQVSRNSAQFSGGGISVSRVFNSILSSNSSRIYGGGSYRDSVYGSDLTGNRASAGGGAYVSSLYNCTVIGNHADYGGGGIYGATARNSIVYFNDNSGGSLANQNYSDEIMSFCCTTPTPSGAGNISLDPQLLDGIHLSSNSPCRGAGSATYAFGTDIGGEPWASPPSIGCDEVGETNFTGALAVSLMPQYTTVAQYGLDGLSGQVIGQPSRLAWDFGDGISSSNASYISQKFWSNPGDYTVTFTAYNTDNPAGVSTSALIHVIPLVSPSFARCGWSGNAFTISFSSQSGVNYAVDVTTNLAPPVVWTPAFYLVGNGTDIQGTNFQATDAARFYRIRSQHW